MAQADGRDVMSVAAGSSTEDGFSLGLPPVGGTAVPISLEQNPHIDRDVGAVVTFFQAIRYGAQLDVPALVLGLRDQNAALHAELQKQRNEVARLQAHIDIQAAELRAAEAAKSALSSDVTKLHAAVRGLTLRAQASWLPTRRSSSLRAADHVSPPLRGVHALSVGQGQGAHTTQAAGSAEWPNAAGTNPAAMLQLTPGALSYQVEGSSSSSSSGGLAAGAVASVVGAVSSMSSSVSSSVSSLLSRGLPLPFGGQSTQNSTVQPAAVAAASSTGSGTGFADTASSSFRRHGAESIIMDGPGSSTGSSSVAAPRIKSGHGTRPSSASSSVASVPGSASRPSPSPSPSQSQSQSQRTQSQPQSLGDGEFASEAAFGHAQTASSSAGVGIGLRTGSDSGRSAKSARSAGAVVLPMSTWLGDGEGDRRGPSASASAVAAVSGTVAAVDDVVAGGDASGVAGLGLAGDHDDHDAVRVAASAGPLVERQTRRKSHKPRRAAAGRQLPLCAQCRVQLRQNSNSQKRAEGDDSLDLDNTSTTSEGETASQSDVEDEDELAGHSGGKGEDAGGPGGDEEGNSDSDSELFLSEGKDERELLDYEQESAAAADSDQFHSPAAAASQGGAGGNPLAGPASAYTSLSMSMHRTSWMRPKANFPRVPSPPFGITMSMSMSRRAQATPAGASGPDTAPKSQSNSDAHLAATGSTAMHIHASSTSSSSAVRDVTVTSPSQAALLAASETAPASPSIISAATSAVANAGGALSDAIRRRLPSWGGSGSGSGSGLGPGSAGATSVGAMSGTGTGTLAAASGSLLEWSQSGTGTVAATSAGPSTGSGGAGGKPPRPAASTGPTTQGVASARAAQVAAGAGTGSSAAGAVSTTAASIAERDAHLPLLPSDALGTVQSELLGPLESQPAYDSAVSAASPPLMTASPQTVPHTDNLIPQAQPAEAAASASAAHGAAVAPRRVQGKRAAAVPANGPSSGSSSRNRNRNVDHIGGRSRDAAVSSSVSPSAWKYRFRHLTAGRGLEEATGAVLAELTRVMMMLEAAAATAMELNTAAVASSTAGPTDSIDAQADVSGVGSASSAASSSSSCEAPEAFEPRKRKGSGTKRKAQSQGKGGGRALREAVDYAGSAKSESWLMDTQLLLSRCLALQLPLLALVQELADRSAFAGTPLAWHGGSERTLNQLHLSAHAQALLADHDADRNHGAVNAATATANHSASASGFAAAGASGVRSDESPPTTFLPTAPATAAASAASHSSDASLRTQLEAVAEQDVDALDASAFVSPAFASPQAASGLASPALRFAINSNGQSLSSSTTLPGATAAGTSASAAATADWLKAVHTADAAQAQVASGMPSIAAEGAEAITEAAEAEAAHELSASQLSELSAAPAAQEPRLVSAIALHALHDVATDVATEVAPGLSVATEGKARRDHHDADLDTEAGVKAPHHGTDNCGLPKPSPASAAAVPTCEPIADAGSPAFAPASAVAAALLGQSAPAVKSTPASAAVSASGAGSLRALGTAASVAAASGRMPRAAGAAEASEASSLLLTVASDIRGSLLPDRIIRRFPWLAAALERMSPEARATTLAVLRRQAVPQSQSSSQSQAQAIPRPISAPMPLLPVRPTVGQIASLLQPGLSLPASVPGSVSPLSPRRGLRILVLDGGGMRGLLELEILKRLEAEAGRPICDLFDLICGTR